jgi:DNA polymerase-3 subunit delta
MPTLSHEDLFKALKKGEFAPVYLLHGEESFYVDKIGEYIENHALTESERSFNQTVLYGKDVDSQTVIDNARRYPVMAARQLVVIREAQSMKDIEQLEKYVSQPASSTILVLCYKHAKYDARKNWQNS